MNKLLANKLKSTLSLESKEGDGGKPKLGGILGGLLGKKGKLGGRQESNLGLLLIENFK